MKETLICIAASLMMTGGTAGQTGDQLALTCTLLATSPRTIGKGGGAIECGRNRQTPTRASRQ